MRDLTSAKWIVLKAALFAILLVAASFLVLLETPTWRTAVLLTLIVWTSARLYYFMFYVIHRYVDPSFRYSGVWSAIRYLVGGSTETK